MKNIIGMLSLCLFISACAEHKMEEASAPQMDISDSAPVETQKQLASAQVPDIYSNGKRIIKTANYRFETKSVKETTAGLEQAVLRFNGYIESSNLQLDHPVLESKISVRVQNEFFDDLLREIDKYAVFVHHRTITTDDVSKDFVDLESRLKTKREVERRYIEILRSKAGTIEELLDAEEKIGALHEEIEATISRINYLKDQVSYSTINLEFYQTIEQQIATIEKPGFLHDAGSALEIGWSGVQNVILGLLHIWPFLLLLGGGILLYHRKRRSIKSAVKV